MTTSARDLDAADAAKILRVELRANFPGVRFSVRIDRFSMGEAINVEWTDGPSVARVGPVTHPFADIERDELTGEILSGGNRYIGLQRDYSPAFWTWGRSQLPDNGDLEVYGLMYRTTFGWPRPDSVQIDG